LALNIDVELLNGRVTFTKWSKDRPSKVQFLMSGPKWEVCKSWGSKLHRLGVFISVSQQSNP